MIGRLERLNTVFMLFFGVAAAMLVYLGVLGAPQLLARDDNPRLVEAELRVQRGRILDRDGVVLAETVGELGELERVYSGAGVCSPAVGYYSLRLGVAGVEGNGQTELVEAVMGLRALTGGAVKLDGQDITDIPPRARIQMGVSHIPEDRYKRAIVPDFSVLENLILGSQRDRFTRNGISIDFAEATRFSTDMINDYQIATPGPETLIRYLSGGNQQRVVVAREFSRDPQVVIAAQPTRGLDVGATEYVRRKLVEMRDHGAGVLLISADLDEIWALSDRVAVIYEGRIVAVKDVDETDVQEIGLLMAGGGNG